MEVLQKRYERAARIAQMQQESEKTRTFVFTPDPRHVRYNYAEKLAALDPAARPAFIAATDICIQRNGVFDFTHVDMMAEYGRAIYPYLHEVDAATNEYKTIREKLMRFFLFARWSNVPHDVRYSIWLCVAIILEKRPCPPLKREKDIICVHEFPQANVASELRIISHAWPTLHFTPVIEEFIVHLRHRFAYLTTFQEFGNHMFNQIGATEYDNGWYRSTSEWVRRQMYIFADLNRLFRFLQIIRSHYVAAPRKSNETHFAAYKRWIASAAVQLTRQRINETFLVMLYPQLIGPGDSDIFREHVPERPTKGGFTSMVPNMNAAEIFGRLYGKDNTELRRNWINISNVLAGAALPRGNAAKYHTEIRLFGFNHDLQTRCQFLKSYYTYTFHDANLPEHRKVTAPMIIRAGGTFFLVAADGYIESGDFGVVAAEWTARMFAADPNYEKWWRDVFETGEYSENIINIEYE